MKRLSGVALAVLFSVAALELGFRAAGPPRLAAGWLFDPVLGQRGPRNGTVPLLSLPLQEQFNQYGFRGEDPAPRSLLPNQFSVFVLGDSITEAAQVPWRHSFVRRLEPLLTERLGHDAEVTSWAFSDYGTANELLAYATEARALRPDVVLLEFLGLNDFVNNGLGFAGKNRSVSDFVRPYLIPEKRLGTVEEFDPLGAGATGLKFTYPDPLWKSLREHSALAAYVEALWRRSEWRRKLNPPTDETQTACPVESEVFLDHPGPDWDETFAVTQRLARALRDEVAKTPGKGPRLVAFYVPSYFELSPLAWERGIAVGLARCTKESFHPDNPEKRFLELFRAAGVEAVSLKGDLLHSGTDPSRLYLPDGHFSSEGHRVVAEALARLLTQPKASGLPDSVTGQSPAHRPRENHGGPGTP